MNVLYSFFFFFIAGPRKRFNANRNHRRRHRRRPPFIDVARKMYARSAIKANAIIIVAIVEFLEIRSIQSDPL